MPTKSETRQTYRLNGYKTSRLYGIVENMTPLSEGEVFDWNGMRFEVQSIVKPTGLVTYLIANVRKVKV